MGHSRRHSMWAGQRGREAKGEAKGEVEGEEEGEPEEEGKVEGELEEGGGVLLLFLICPARRQGRGRGIFVVCFVCVLGEKGEGRRRRLEVFFVGS